MKVEDLTDPIVWQNSVYEETLRRKDDYSAEYKFLAERDSNEPARARSFELYEINTDAWEINDLYGNPEYDSISIGLVQLLRKWVIETDDRYVDTNALELELKKLHGDGASTCFLTTLMDS